MELRYLYHSGVAVETDTQLLVFDYWKDGALPGGVPDLARRVGKPLTVFVSHVHPDHYNPAIFQWEKSVPDVTYVLSTDVPDHPGCHRIGPGKRLDLGNLTVTALRSTDEGVAFLVETDGAAIFHSGDLHWWHWPGEDPHWNESMAHAYQAQIRRLAEQHLDVAFVPVDGRQEEAWSMGIDYFASHVDCPRLVPIHFTSDPSILRRLRETPGPWQGRLLILDDDHPAARVDLP